MAHDWGDDPTYPDLDYYDEEPAAPTIGSVTQLTGRADYTREEWAALRRRRPRAIGFLSPSKLPPPPPSPRKRRRKP